MPDSLLRAAARGGSAVSAASQQRAQTLLDMKYPPRRQTDPDPKPAGGPVGSTNGITNQSLFQYNATLPPLSPQQQELLGSRRRMATRQFGETEATAKREMDRARGDSLRQQANLERDQQVASREGMATLAGRGVGRSPMFVNPFQRQLADRTQRQTGELQSNLARILANLEGQIRQAGIMRDREYQQIDWDRTSFRSDPSTLLGG